MLEASQTLCGHTDRVWTLAWNSTGTILASSGSDKTIRLWARDRADNWICVSILTETHNKSIRRLCWSPCGNYLASASFDSTVCIWRRQPIDGTWSTLVNLEGHESEVKSVAWSANGEYLASCGRDRTIWIWERAHDSNDDIDFEENYSAEQWDCSDVKNDHSKDVKHIVWHPKYPILASCSYDDTVKLFHKDGDDWVCFDTLSVHTSTVWSADFSESGEYLATCSDDKTVRIWKNHSHNKLPMVESNSWKCISVIQGYHGRTIYDISWSKHDNVIASASGDNSIAIYKSSPGVSQDGCDIFTCCDKLAQAHDCDVNSVEWNPKIPGLLASGGDDRKVKLWNHKIEDRGTKPQTVIDELMKIFSNSQIETNIDSFTPSQMGQTTDVSRMCLSVDGLDQLSDIVYNMQRLKIEVYHDQDRRMLEKLLDLTLTAFTPSIDISHIDFEDKDGAVKEISTEIITDAGDAKYSFRMVLDGTKFALKVPRRSIKFTTIKKDLFLIDKTGDLFKVLPTGECQFLLGHLFMFSDVQFITHNDGRILYILTADRDEKIRISNYPDTFNIERFCFGHKNFLKRLIVVDEKKFVSIDQHNDVCIWNLEDLSNGDRNKPLFPEKVLSVDESAKKRICVR